MPTVEASPCQRRIIGQVVDSQFRDDFKNVGYPIANGEDVRSQLDKFGGLVYLANTPGLQPGANGSNPLSSTKNSG